MASIREKILKDGTKSHEVRINRRGQPPMSKSFAKKEDARRWANEIESKIDKGESVSRVKEKTLLGDVLAHYIKEKKVEGSELLRIQQLNHDLKAFTLESFKRDQVKKYIRALLETKIPPPANRKKFHPLFDGKKRDEQTYAPSTVRKLIYTLKKAIEYHALEHRYPIDASLFEDVDIPAAWSNPRERRLEDGEEERLYEGAAKAYTFKREWVLLIKCFLATACRSQELLYSTYKDLLLEQRTLNIPKERSKTGKARQIPLSKVAVECFTEMKEKFRKKDEPRIFWQWKTTAVLGQAFKRLSKRAKVNDFHIHDLRHEAISRLFEDRKLEVFQIMKMTGHSEFSTIERYLHLRGIKNIAELLD